MERRLTPFRLAAISGAVWGGVVLPLAPRILEVEEFAPSILLGVLVGIPIGLLVYAVSRPLYHDHPLALFYFAPVTLFGSGLLAMSILILLAADGLTFADLRELARDPEEFLLFVFLGVCAFLLDPLRGPLLLAAAWGNHFLLRRVERGTRRRQSDADSFHANV